MTTYIHARYRGFPLALGFNHPNPVQLLREHADMTISEILQATPHRQVIAEAVAQQNDIILRAIIENHGLRIRAPTSNRLILEPVMERLRRELHDCENATVDDVALHWFVNTALLIQLGALPDDDRNGFFCAEDSVQLGD